MALPSRPSADNPATPLKLGVSSCLLGAKVRYDGGHKLDKFLRDTLGRFAEFVPVCPEVESGLPVPRPSLRLVGDPASPRLVFPKTGRDHTAAMQTWARSRLDELADANLCGFVFKSRSPSSGMERVKVYPEGGGAPANKGVGVFARAFMDRFPELPVEEEGRLNDPRLRENFIERIFVMKRWRDMLSHGFDRGALVDFHTRHKSLLLSHSVERYRELGRITAHGPRDLDALRAAYSAKLSEAMRLPPTVKKHVNVLMHMLGHFKKDIESDEKQELLEIIDDFHKGLTPLIVPVTLLAHLARKYEKQRLLEQHYLKPHPLELKLRNHA
ncbi:MAG: YbgA family protein [Desulfovibrionaceae bacterium]